MSRDQRIVRMPLPVNLIRRMDQLIIDRAGGFESRAEFIREAIEAQILELSFDDLPEEDSGTHSDELATARPQPATGQVPVVAEGGKAESGLSEHSVPPVDLNLSGFEGASVVERADAVVRQEPLFGMHNRDFPSLWAAYQIAELTVERVISAEQVYEAVVERSWHAGAELLRIEAEMGSKVSYLFPTNREKVKSAASAFRNYAIGDYWEGEDGALGAGGPLYLWGVVQLQREAGELLIGLTEQGAKLLAQIDGLGPSAPHQPEHALTFFSHLAESGSVDWRCFRTVLSCVMDRPKRLELVDAFKATPADWSKTKDSVVENYVAGYVARSREWGLMEPKMVDRRYRLTDFGEQLLSSMQGEDRD